MNNSLMALLALSGDLDDFLEEIAPRKHVQTSGPKCKKCGAYTTYARVESHGLCMKCEQETK